MLQDNVVLSVNQEYVDGNDDETVLHLKDNDEVALIPPLSGG